MSEPMWNMTGAEWMKWFELWQVTPWTDGEQMILRPGSRVPAQYVDMIRAAKPAIVAHLIEQRESARARMEHCSALLAPFEERQALDDPAYLGLLADFFPALADYEACCALAPEPIATPA